MECSRAMLGCFRWLKSGVGGEGGVLWWPVPWLGHPSPVDRDPRSRLGTFPSPRLADGALVTS